MIQRQHRQRSIFEAAIGSIEQLVDGLMEPALQRLDAGPGRSATPGSGVRSIGATPAAKPYPGTARYTS